MCALEVVGSDRTEGLSRRRLDLPGIEKRRDLVQNGTRVPDLVAGPERRRLVACLDNLADRVAAENGRGVPFRRAPLANPSVHRIDRTGLYPNQQVVPLRAGPFHLDIDEGIVTVDGAGHVLIDGFHCFSS
ncbi:hypothetical protein DEA8626_01046 [Defluviimonas aquaemixtae]|uniref:Uncharacterized protein n=1 Tax=Albidovulum aquaemixtae TaxID=1542388 RepID=A0A2R8B4U4_9RHOB|nr:hypothetical protein [Defluviimonas aquaemixtae]SPH17523.1 hypothetical protein DEA8626_01046 [Defluviimonas aquaemixtae]